MAPKQIPTTRAPITKPGDLGNGVVVKVAQVESVKGTAQGPGEIAGPALRVTISVNNGAAKALAMGSSVVNLYYGTGRIPAGPLSGPGAKQLTGSIRPGATATGTYVFGVPKNQRTHIEVEFSYTTDAPTVIFSGAL